MVPLLLLVKNKVAEKLKIKVKEENSETNFWTLHCIIHQETLCSKGLQLNNVMETVIKVINFFRLLELNNREFV